MNNFYEPSLVEGEPIREPRKQWLATTAEFFANSKGFERW